MVLEGLSQLRVFYDLKKNHGFILFLYKIQKIIVENNSPVYRILYLRKQLIQI